MTALDRALTLTTRQLAILALVCRGWGNRRIARKCKDSTGSEC